MPDGILIPTADAITAALDAHDFGVEFTPERSYAEWDLELEDAGTLRVDVVPVAHVDSELGARGRTDYVVTVDVGVRKRFGQSSQVAATGRIDRTELDALVLLIEQIHEHLCSPAMRELTTNMHWKASKIRMAYNPRHLRELRQYTGIIRLTYDVSKAL